MSLLNNISASTSFSLCFYSGPKFPSNPKIGTVFLNTIDDMQYVYCDTNTGWMPLGTGSIHNDISEYNTNFSEIKEMKCISCGAPLKIRGKYDIKCEYCGKVYIGE